MMVRSLCHSNVWKVKSLAPYIITLKTLKPERRKVLIDHCTKDQIRSLEVVGVNLVKNSVPSSLEQIHTCWRWQSPKLLALQGYPIKKKKKLLQQGGFSGAIVPVIASALFSVLGSWIMEEYFLVSRWIIEERSTNSIADMQLNKAPRKLWKFFLWTIWLLKLCSNKI